MNLQELANVSSVRTVGVSLLCLWGCSYQAHMFYTFQPGRFFLHTPGTSKPSETGSSGVIFYSGWNSFLIETLFNGARLSTWAKSADKWRLCQAVGTWSANRNTQDMEEENSCRCDYEGGAEAEAESCLLCQKSRHIQLHRERHRRRMAQFVAAALLLLLCGILAVFLTLRLERPCDCATDSQVIVHI